MTTYAPCPRRHFVSEGTGWNHPGGWYPQTARRRPSVVAGARSVASARVVVPAGTGWYRSPLTPTGGGGLHEQDTARRHAPRPRHRGAHDADTATPAPLIIGGASPVAGGATARARPRRKRTAKRLRRRAAAWLVALAAAVLPRLYTAYMRLVEATSRHDDRLTALLLAAAERHDRAVALLWHQEVFTVAYNYRHYRGHTLVSVSDFGHVIAALLRRCNFTIVRGGSGSHSRRRPALATLIEHMRTHPRVIYGLTVDGSRGPAYRMKRGGPAIARACGAPVVLVRTWYRRGVRLPTWDRAQIPLPFNRRVTLASGPYWIAPDADDAALEAFRAHLERELLELTARAYLEAGARREADWRRGLPPGWQPRWAAGETGHAHGPYDLRPDRPPPWAHRRSLDGGPVPSSAGVRVPAAGVRRTPAQRRADGR
jgi:lysophospholipid acyltransferase (LPLAT)-like uncharacterized protein